MSANFIPVEVFHALIDTYRKHIPIWHRYWELRRRALGLDVLHVYDIKAPLSARPPRIPFKQAVEWIAQGMAPLGDDYVRTLRRGVLEQRWSRCLSQPGQAGRGLLGPRTGHASVHSDELYRRPQAEYAGGTSSATPCIPTSPGRTNPLCTQTTRSSWRKWPLTSTRHWCARISLLHTLIRSFKSP